MPWEEWLSRKRLSPVKQNKLINRWLIEKISVDSKIFGGSQLEIKFEEHVVPERGEKAELREAETHFL